MAREKTASAHHDVIVIGAGFSGIGAGIKLDEAGFSDFLILEQGDGVGGAWHFNTYPGVAVDIPSLSYSFSFERNPYWSRVFAPGAELKAYAEHCVDKYRLRSRIRLNTGVTGCTFDEARDVWRVATASGEVLTARFIIGATGVLTQPKNPDIPGIETFAGTRMHTARWDHDVDLGGKRVAIIGTGASALQVIPEIAPAVAHLTVFQRTPIWVIPKPDVAMSPRLQNVMAGSKVLQWSARLLSQAIVEVGFVLTGQYHRPFQVAKLYEKIARDYLQKAVKDPVTRDKLTPRYGFGCKRPSTSNTYLQAFNRANVALVTEAIEAVTPTGVRTQDGVLHDIDVLICATGFKVFENGRVGAGLSQCLPDPRPQRLQRRVVFPAHRDAVPPHRALPEGGAREAGEPRGSDAGRQRPLFPRDEGAHRQPGVLQQPLRDGQQLLLRQARRRAFPSRHQRRGALAQHDFPAQRLPLFGALDTGALSAAFSPLRGPAAAPGKPVGR
ncbi:MAG: putative monooxygenase [Moraxellaceae bacterium]|nr:putative monooxygenase [Moraxellaceae bacterium]